MTYRPHIRLQAGGPLFGTEQWSINLNMRLGTDSGEPTGIILDAWESWTRDNVQDAYDDVAAYIQDPRAGWSSAAQLGYVKLNVIADNGRYRNPGETVAVYNETPSTIDGTLTPGPAQVALCISLLTDLQRGRASRGRFYVPCGAFAVDATTGRVSNPVLLDAVTAAQDFLNDLNDMPGLDVNNPRVVIASNLGSPGPANNVTAVAVGNVLDTQRRRRGDLPEAYLDLPVTIQ
uniref:Uncharacterized protein n=1 Tax=uncultured prokaryote TaxID=198431 RepID=A0A0H5QLV3_9ZZZZ|nr:hypothetical protein [uncultured prokaryote]